MSFTSSVRDIVRELECHDMSTPLMLESKPAVVTSTHSVPALADIFEHGAKERILAKRWRTNAKPSVTYPSASVRSTQPKYKKSTLFASGFIEAWSLDGELYTHVPVKMSAPIAPELGVKSMLKPKKTFEEWGLELLAIVDTNWSSSFVPSSLRPYQKIDRYQSARSEAAAIITRRQAFASLMRPISVLRGPPVNPMHV